MTLTLRNARGPLQQMGIPYRYGLQVDATRTMIERAVRRFELKAKVRLPLGFHRRRLCAQRCDRREARLCEPMNLRMVRLHLDGPLGQDHSRSSDSQAAVKVATTVPAVR